jgi:hypothetical protein
LFLTMLSNLLIGSRPLKAPCTEYYRVKAG